MAIRWDHIIVGASRDDEVAGDAGATYLYRKDGAEWILEKKVTHPDLSFDARFGTSVAINSTRYMIAGYNLESEGFHRGAVCIYSLINYNRPALVRFW